tara:strand:- start:576 stop:800 length:225 start_codon:yes stop_codon:yes gene_type:complete
MKIGDLVKLSATHGPCDRVGLIVELVEKKCWRTDVFGNKIDWNKIDSEPHAVVLINSMHSVTLPVIDLKVIDEG